MTCLECGFGLVQQSTWLKASKEQRAKWKALQWAPMGAKGLCRNCYQREYRRTLGCVS